MDPSRTSFAPATEDVPQLGRPHHSPRMTPKKRALPADLESLDSSLAKCVKRPYASTEADASLKNSNAPEIIDLDEAVKIAVGFYKELWTIQTIEEECGYPQDEETREDRSGLACEEWAKANYEAIRSAANALFPWAGGLKPAGPGANYDILQFHGVKPPGLKTKPFAKKATQDEEQQIRDYRNSSKQARAREALLTTCSALSCRKEKLWAELSESDLIDIIKKSGLRRVKSRKMLNLIKQFINDEMEKGKFCCQFASALVRPESYIRIACGRGVGYSVPASILIVHHMPLWNVFLKMEDDTPFCGAANSQAWWKQNRREVAFQELNFAADEDDMRNERFPASMLKPDPQLKKLLQSQTPVVYLDILAALSTREASKKYGLSEIVKNELANLFREAKSKKQAVIFVLGTEDPRKLAEKVYLRPPLNDFGLKCGFFRWRSSPDAPWAREKEYSDRSTFMLQMP